MEQKRDLAIVLRWAPFEERHRVVTALTEHHGKISALARNSIQSRRFGGSLEPFAASEWYFVERPGADLYRVEEAHIRRSFEGLRKDFQRLALASVFIELMIKVAPEREPCQDLFKLLSNALSHLEDEIESGREPKPAADMSLLNAFLAKILQWSGNQPQLGACSSCEAPLESLQLHTPVTCIVQDACWTCSNCRVQESTHHQERSGNPFHHSMLRITPAALLDFYMSLVTPIRQVPTQARASLQEHRALFVFLEALMTFHVPGFDRTPLKSLRFLDLKSTAQLPSGNPQRGPLHLV